MTCYHGIFLTNVIFIVDMINNRDIYISDMDIPILKKHLENFSKENLSQCRTGALHVFLPTKLYRQY